VKKTVVVFLVLFYGSAWGQMVCQPAPALEKELTQLKLGDTAKQAMVQALAARVRNLNQAHARLVAVASVKAPLEVCFSGVVNAFVTGANRPVVVFTGLLMRFGEDPDLLAAVLAHEFGHLSRQHFSYQQRAVAAYSAHASAVGRQDFYRTGDIAHAERLAKQVMTQNMSAFSRQQEIDADDFGTQLLFAAGYKPEVMVKTMLRFLATGGQETTQWWQDHPGWPERLARVEPRVLDLESDRSARMLAGANDTKGLARQINDWLRQLPDSGNAWFQKAALLRRLGNPGYVEAYERALDGTQPTLAVKPEEIAEMWLSLCVGLYEAGYKLESAECSKNIKDGEQYERFERATFGRVLVAGEQPGSSLLTARDERGSKFITNQPSSLAFRGIGGQKVAPWHPIRFSLPEIKPIELQ
jgi:metalloprotease